MNAKNPGKGTRIGIYSGTFDPVHSGHIAFALQAVQAAKLNRLYLMPERSPRSKQHVTHYAHRVAMVRRATRPHPQLAVLENEDKTFSVAHTLPRLQGRFTNATLVFICGSDVLLGMSSWPHIERLLRGCELCIGRRQNESRRVVEQAVAALPIAPQDVTIVDSHAPHISSSSIRRAIRERRGVRGLLRSVHDYAAQEWLYL